MNSLQYRYCHARLLVWLLFFLACSAQAVMPAPTSTPSPASAAAVSHPQTQPAVIMTGAANTASTAPVFPAGFVVVQSTYLEQVIAAAKSAIDAASDRVALMVTMVQIVGVMLGLIGAGATFLGYKTYQDFQKNIEAIKKSRDEVETHRKEIEAVVLDTKRQAKDFESKLLSLEKLFIGIHACRLIIGELSPARSLQQIDAARREVGDAKELYLISKNHDNPRIQSFIAANLSLILMRAQSWDEALAYSNESVACNPKDFSDRGYNQACIHARKYEALDQVAAQAVQAQAAKMAALELLARYFKRHPDQASLDDEFDTALSDDDLRSLKDEIAAMRSSNSKNKNGS